MLDALFIGPPGYTARNGWPAWAVLPAAVLIFGLATLVGGGLSLGYALLSGPGGPAVAPGAMAPQMMMQLATWIVGLQVGLIALTYLAAGFFSSNRAVALALKPPAGGWRVLPMALLPLFLITAAWTGLLMWLKPSIVIQDLRPFQQLLHGDTLALMLLAICIGAPLSEELLFRGFLFSGLAKTRLGLIGHGAPDDDPVDGAARRLLDVRADRGAGYRPLLLVAARAHGQPVGHDLLPRRLQ